MGGIRAVCLVLEIETNREVKVKLNGATLYTPTQSILNFYVYFRSIKCSISLLLRPTHSHLIKYLFQLLLRLLPQLVRPNRFLRSCSQLNFIREAKQLRIDGVHEVKAVRNLLADLFNGTENMSIVLLKPPHPRQPRKRPTQLIPMQHTKVSYLQRHIPIRVRRLLRKEDTMPRAVHRLKPLHILSSVHEIHIVLVIVVVA